MTEWWQNLHLGCEHHLTIHRFAFLHLFSKCTINLIKPILSDQLFKKKFHPILGSKRDEPSCWVVFLLPTSKPSLCGDILWNQDHIFAIFFCRRQHVNKHIWMCLHALLPLQPAKAIFSCFSLLEITEDKLYFLNPEISADHEKRLKNIFHNPRSCVEEKPVIKAN